MNPITKTIIAALTLAALASGKVVGRSSISSSGAVTNYDASGRVVSRESTSGNWTTICDASGRNVGRYTTSPQR